MSSEIHSIGKEIRALVEVADRRSDDHPLERWVTANHVRGVLDLPFDDEVNLITLARDMMGTGASILGRRGNDLEVNRVVDPFIGHYHAIMDNPKPHLEACLREQRRQICEFLKTAPDPRELNRLIRNRKRGIDRKIDRRDVLVNEYLAYDIRVLSVALRNAVKRRGALKRRIPKTPERIIADIENLEDQMREMVDQINELYGEVQKRDWADRILVEISGYFSELGLEDDEEDSEDKADNSGKKLTPPKYGPKHGLKKGKKPTYTRRRRRSQEEEVDPHSEFEKDIHRLKAITDGASEVRLMVSKDPVAARAYLRSWTALLRLVGYEGRIKPVRYSQINSADTTHLICGSGLNAHRHQWAHNIDNDLLHIFQVYPNILLSYLQN